MLFTALYFDIRVNFMRKLIVGSLFLLWALLGAQASFAQKRIYLAPDDHTDYMWTANEEEYRDVFLTTIDYYLDQMDATADNPPPYQARWNADGSLWLWVYQKNRSTPQFDRLINRIKDGHFSVPLNALVLSSGGTPAEAVLRGMYYPGLIQRAYGIDFPLAIAMENQTLPYGLSSLWAGSGAKYSWKGVCGCSTHVPHLSNREREIYYLGGRDDSRVLMKWNSLLLDVTGDNTSIGGYAEGRNPEQTIDFVTHNPSFAMRYPFPVVGVFGKGEDDLITIDNEFVTAAKQLTDTKRHVSVSNQIDFFRDFETHYGAQLETFAASYGNEWELYSASLAEVSARVKRAVEKLRTAEALATLVALKNPKFMRDRIAARDQAMLNLGLYYEHNWTADGPVSRSERANWQRKVEAEITAYVDRLHDDAKNQLGTMIARSGTAPRFYVLNSLSWERTDYADFPVSRKNLVHVVDLTNNQVVPSQYVAIDGRTYLRILASNVPSVGYKVFEIRNGAGPFFSNAAGIHGNVMENTFYRIAVSETGAITSLIDKLQNNREFVRKINGRWANDLGGSGGSLAVENFGAVSATLRAISLKPRQHITRITLFRNSNRIDIGNEIKENFGETLTWGYSFNIDSPDVWHEEVGAIIRAKLLPHGGHYSPRNARYDWLTINHFADVSGNDSGITLSNADTYYMKLGHSTHLELDTDTPQLNILAGGQVDGEKLGIPNQGEDELFLQRFAMQTHGKFDQAAAMRFSLEHQNPFVAGAVTGMNPLYDESDYSFLTISDPNILLWALKPAEDGIEHGVIARVWNQANFPGNYTLSLAPGILSGKRTTHIETDMEDANIVHGNLSASLAGNQIQTHRLQLHPANTSRF
ncbi:MAG: glycoside hydrolase [Nitrosomonas sp. PRO4]|nr:glycoside hydrolase [Nitrosomonas sp. PRO4]